MGDSRGLRLKLARGHIDISTNWTQRSYWIALHLDKGKQWASHLTAAELPWLTKALESIELWDQFITPRSEQWRFQKPPPAIFQITTPSSNKSEAEQAESEQVEQVDSAGPAGKRAFSEDTNGGLTTAEAAAEKRLRINGSAAADNDDVMSVVSGSGSDIDMWTGDASLSPKAMSPATHVPKPLRPDDWAVAAAESSIVCAMAAFHARTAIFEQYVSVLCDSTDCKLCTDAVDARRAVADAEERLAGGGAAGEGPAMAMAQKGADAALVPLVSRSLDADEDYDEDEGEGQDEGGESQVTQPPSIPAALKLQAATIADADALPDTNTTSDGIRASLRSVFHTLDELGAAAHEHQVHEMHRQQIMQTMEQRAQEPKDMLVSKLGSLHNMKNLAHFIDKHRSSVTMSTRELSHLLSEVRPKRTKWANDRRVGQVELYDALELVLQELKAMGEAAVPFLQQVKRKDAPDYYKVIKHPMDLAAMAKNLRSEVYNSKRQFADHLQLIRDNCYTYNTDPGNYYRKSVDALLAKSKVLMEAVPDIVVREKGATAQAQAQAANGDDAHTECGDESGNESPSASRTGYGHREDSLDDTPAPPSANEDRSFEPTKPGSPLVLLPPPPPEDQPGASASASVLAQNIARAGASAAIAELAEGYDRPLADRIWRARVRRPLAEYLRRADASAAIAEGYDRPPPPARTPAKMRDFLRFAHDSSDCIAAADITALEEDARAEADVPRLRTAGASADADAERRHWLQRAEQLDAQTWPFVEECEPAAGLPQLEPPGAQAQRDGVLRWLNDDCDEPLPDTGTENHRPSIEAYAAARFPDNPMWRGMADNVDRLRSIREIDSKIWAAKLNIPLGHLHPHSAAPRALDDPAPCARAIHAAYANTADPPGGLRLDHHCARALLHRTTALILAHTGFDAITAAAASTLNDFFIDYMANLGRSLRTYTDKHARTMSSEAILAHALYDNGIEDLGELEYYARGDVAKHHTKLCEVQKKLSKAFQDTMADGRLDAEPMDAGLDTGDAYVTGSVGGGLADLGDDFFGFKELGLDKEFGLESLSVPQRLWYARPPGSADGAGLTPYQQQMLLLQQQQQQQQQEALAHPQPKPWPPLRTPRGQIGLLHPFICEKLKHVNAVECVPGFTTDGELIAKEEGEDNEDEDEDEAYALPDTWVPVPEDESLPTRLRYGATRAKVPPPNYLTHPRTHMHVGSGQVPDTPTTAGAGAGRNAKKRPAKNTASKTTATATTIGKASRKKSAGA